MGFVSWRDGCIVAFLAIGLQGVIDYVTKLDPNDCEMTYMFEYPEYIRVSMKPEIMQKFPRYNLYLYGEGIYASNLRQGILEGIPVIFVPGNSGSHKQVRSLGSMALQMARSRFSKYHFDFFALDFNQDISGMYGGVLGEQTAFLYECIRHIQDMYKSSRLKIILVGHSMGGVIARAVFMYPGFDSKVVPLIITLAAVHKAPVLQFDPYLAKFYEQLNDFWITSQSYLHHVSIVSIGGGQRDVLVRSDLTFLPDMKNATSLSRITTLSTAVPGVWVTADHLCIVWCKQLVKVTSRALFDIVDKSTGQVYTDMIKRNTILHYHFLRRFGGKHYLPHPLSKLPFPPGGEWILKDEPSWHFIKNKVLSTFYIIIPLEEKETVILISSGIMREDWVFACTSDSNTTSVPTCSDGESLAQSGQAIPFKSGEGFLFQMKASSLLSRQYDHIVVYIPPSGGRVDVVGERYKRSLRHKGVVMPFMLRGLTTFSPTRLLAIPITEGAVFYNVSLIGLTGVWQAYSLVLETRVCKSGTQGEGILKFTVPWSNEDKYVKIRSRLGAQTRILVKLYSPQPPNYKNRYPQLHMMLDPSCSYALSQQVLLRDVATQFVSHYGSMFPGYVIAVLLYALGGQLSITGVRGHCPSLVHSLRETPSVFYLVMVPNVISFITGLVNHVVQGNFQSHMLLYDVEIHEAAYLAVVRLILYLASNGLLLVLAIIITSGVTFLASLYQWLADLATRFIFRTKTPDASKMKMDYMPVVLSCALASLTLGVAAGVMFIAGYFIHALKVILLCNKNRYLENRRGLSIETTRWHFHLTLMMLWFHLCLTTAPTSVHWLRNIHFTTQLVNDPFLMPAILVALSCAVLWQGDVPYAFRIYYSTLSFGMKMIACLVVIFGLNQFFILPYFMCAAFVMLASHQLVTYTQKAAVGKQE